MLSKKCKYAIHALVHMAKEPDVKFLIKDIAGACRIPKKFLEGILLELKRAGILGSKQGKSGGYFLRRKPKDVNLAEVVRLMNVRMKRPVPFVLLFWRCAKPRLKCSKKTPSKNS